MIKEKILLITGGTGSFGNAVIQRFLKTDVKEIRIFSRDEKKQHDMRLQYNNEKLKFYIGDVRHYDSVETAMCGVDYVFHAAALKQVPSCEFYPMEAYRTNVEGTDNVIKAAIACQVENVLCLSTDKAAYPINAMGISKAMMEKVAVAKARMLGNSKPTICITRYGNVMGSRGSVIPLFEAQAEFGDELTVTDPAMTRFMMTLEEAVELVLYAFSNGKQGDLFVQKAPAATIEELAGSIIEMKKSASIIKTIGTRHGEKLYETLLTREEKAKAEDLGGYYRVSMDDRDLNYNQYFEEGQQLNQDLEAYTSHNTHRLNREEMKSLLLRYGMEEKA
ncbi:polysaccharide biosynthesis protein [Macellibacteroides fermentans]|uniref:polysaccharide biosynthesis protein n=1 Tax=Macellibacteroides fermentans TaxID=879969 RepID=UPI00406CBA0A